MGQNLSPKALKLRPNDDNWPDLATLTITTLHLTVSYYKSLSEPWPSMLQDAEETFLSYESEKKPLKLKTENPGEVDFLCELIKGRFSVTANVNHGGRLCTAKIFDKSNTEGDEASKREFKNLKTLKHEKIVSLILK